jgi:hypothetical protein
MNRKTTLAAIGGYQPFLFCIGMYFVALFFSIFICSAVFYAFYPKKSIAKDAAGSGHKTAAMAPGGSRMLLTVTK